MDSGVPATVIQPNRHSTPQPSFRRKPESMAAGYITAVSDYYDGFRRPRNRHSTQPSFNPPTVIPAKAGIYGCWCHYRSGRLLRWIPAFAGMTVRGRRNPPPAMPIPPQKGRGRLRLKPQPAPARHQTPASGGGLARFAGRFKAAVPMRPVAERLVVRRPAAAERYPLPVGNGVIVAALVNNLNCARYPQRPVAPYFHFDICHIDLPPQSQCPFAMPVKGILP